MEIGYDGVEGITDETVAKPVIRVSGGLVIIDGIADGTTAYIYTIDGRLAHYAEIKNGIVTGLETSGMSGLYIIRAGSYSFKVRF